MNSNIPQVGLLALLVGLTAGYVFFGSSTDNRSMMRASIDQHFIEEMIPHHEGAIEMAKLALERSKRDDVRSLATDIIDAQTREITDMKAWYRDWFGKDVLESSSMMGMGHGEMGHMQGVEGDLDALQAASSFDEEFLSQMIVHHEMAVMMARMLEAGTEREEMKNLADQIKTSQSREIEMMKSWLTTL